MQTREYGLGLLLQVVDQHDGEGVRRERALGLPVHAAQHGPQSDCGRERGHPRVQREVVPEEGRGLEGAVVVERELAGEGRLALGRPRDGEEDHGDLGAEVATHVPA